MPRDKVTGRKVERSTRGVALWPPAEPVDEEEEPLTAVHRRMYHLKQAIENMQGAGFHFPSYWREGDPQRAAFFGMAKLWRVIRTVVTELYMDGLINGVIFLEDRDGNKYSVRLMHKRDSGYVPIEELEDTTND